MYGFGYGRDPMWFAILTSVIQGAGNAPLAPSDIMKRTDELFDAAVTIRQDQKKRRQKEILENAPRSRLAFEPTGLIKPGDSRLVVSHPHVCLWLEWLAVHPDSQPHFDIIDVKAGNRTLFPNSLPMKASMFPVLPEDDAAREWALKWMSFGDHRVQVSEPVIIVAHNKSSEPREFSAAFTCKVITDVDW